MRLSILPILSCDKLKLDADFWTEIAGNTVSGCLTLIGIVIAAILAYQFAIRQKRKETFIALDKTRYERKLQALEQCWKLLAYTTDTQNPKTILLWEKTKGGEKVYSVKKSNAVDFLEALPEYFYQTGLGIYLSKQIKEKLFEYRNIVFGFLLREKENTENAIVLKNSAMAQTMITLHQEFVQLIKDETNNIENTGFKK